MLIRIFVVLSIALFVVGIVFASYDVAPAPKATPDLAEYIIKTPAEVYKKHGYSERTDIMYNLARFKELYIESTKQMQMLKERVKLLEDNSVPVPVPDTNDVIEGTTGHS